MTSDEIKADIAATRAELAETADALAARLDAKAQVGKKIALGITAAALVLVVVQRVRK
jgi:Protein of unknown function (DUF3618)